MSLPRGIWSRAEALAWLEASQRFGIKLGLENARRLLHELGRPETGLKFFHVAGTNGKGSVCAMLDAVLRQAGFRTGLYTSPHLVDFSERIRVQGEPIGEDALREGLARLRQISSAWDHAPTFFELATALAAWHFAREGCEWVVWETGMGGRLDATNVVMPEAAILTPVGFDHEKWLGSTLAQIAFEKAGIMKPGRPAVSAPQAPEAAEVFRARAAEVGARLDFVEDIWQGPLGLPGAHQRANAALAARALEAVGLDLPWETLAAGLAGTRWPGRFQITEQGWVLDGAHNPHAAEALAAAWRERFGGGCAVLLFSCLADKDVRAMARVLEPLAVECHLAPLATPRAAALETLRAAWRIPTLVHPDVREAVAALRTRPQRVLVTGSLYLVGEVLETLGLKV